MKNFKIMHVITGLNVGGAELMLKRLIECSGRDKAYEYIVVSLTDIGHVGKLLVDSGVTVISLNMKGFLDAPKAIYTLRKLIINNEPAIVQSWMYHADLLGGISARLAGVSSIIWGIRATDLSLKGSKSTFVIRNICSKLSSFIPARIVCAAEAARNYHIALGYNAARMQVIPNGFVIDSIQKNTDFVRLSSRMAIGVTDNQILIGFVGRFNSEKDQENFINAANILSRQHKHLIFLMIGRDLLNTNKELMSWIQRDDFANRFILLGERSDVSQLFQAMDIFCLSSRTEGFPNVVGEAMGAGVPCVVTDVGDAAFLVGSTGIIVPKENPIALAAGVSQLLDLPSIERKLLGVKARERIITEFSMQKARQRFEDLYKQLA